MMATVLPLKDVKYVKLVVINPTMDPEYISVENKLDDLFPSIRIPTIKDFPVLEKIILQTGGGK